MAVIYCCVCYVDTNEIIIYQGLKTFRTLIIYNTKIHFTGNYFVERTLIL